MRARFTGGFGARRVRTSTAFSTVFNARCGKAVLNTGSETIEAGPIVLSSIQPVFRFCRYSFSNFGNATCDVWCCGITWILQKAWDKYNSEREYQRKHPATLYFILFYRIVEFHVVACFQIPFQANQMLSIPVYAANL